MFTYIFLTQFFLTKKTTPITTTTTTTLMGFDTVEINLVSTQVDLVFEVAVEFGNNLQFILLHIYMLWWYSFSSCMFHYKGHIVLLWWMDGMVDGCWNWEYIHLISQVSCKYFSQLYNKTSKCCFCFVFIHHC